ncbi:hypothetical protein C6P45_005342 [Maudiozyma exigua]|uniref:MADS-box domain-containing protein n=1 Tax=Maudiozyma exigua TaxID=34358 RepID=A0A9P6WBX4_MAUEX|nr:hypothetical protein C6P45_005342 [Kazachstania exigua]
MGRRKIDIQPITEDRNRTVTFIKRKAGLFKKAHELSVLCQAEVSLIILGANNTFYEYSSVAVDDLMKYYNDDKTLRHVIKHPSDFGDFKQREFVTLNKNVRRRNYAKNRIVPPTSNTATNTDSTATNENKNDQDSGTRPLKRQRIEDTDNGSDSKAPVSPNSVVSLPDIRSLSQNATRPTLPHLSVIPTLTTAATSTTTTDTQPRSSISDINNIPQPVHAHRHSTTPPFLPRNMESSTGTTPTALVTEPIPGLKLDPGVHHQQQSQHPLYQTTLHTAMNPSGYIHSHIPLSSPVTQPVPVGYQQRMIQYTHGQRYLQPIPNGSLPRQNIGDSNITNATGVSMIASQDWYQANNAAAYTGISNGVPIYITAPGPAYQGDYSRLHAYPQSIPMAAPPQIDTNTAASVKRYLPPTPTSYERVVLPSVRRPSSAAATTTHESDSTSIDSSHPHQSPKAQLAVTSEAERA